jgi:hypothetical protein
MKQTNTYISGSVALVALHPASFRPNDIDFYVSSSTGNTFVEYITSLDVERLPILSSPYANMGNIKKIMRFRRASVTGTINIIFSRTSNPLQLIFEFHSTLLMNYISWYGVVSFYPELTLNKKGFANVVHPGVFNAFDKYKLRGFRIELNSTDMGSEFQDHLCTINPYCPLTLRHIHDGHSLIRPFPDYICEGEKQIVSEGYLVWKLYVGFCSDIEWTNTNYGIDNKKGFSINAAFEVGELFQSLKNSQLSIYFIAIHG